MMTRPTSSGSASEMERAEARKLQPHYIRVVLPRGVRAARRQIVQSASRAATRSRNVPAEIRRRDRQIGRGSPLLRRYARVTFEKELVAPRASRRRSSSRQVIRCSTRPST